MALLNNEGATSSSFTRRWNYNVFLSFRGDDTRENFTSHLHKALCNKGIHTYIDDKLRRGEEILEELLHAIKNSSILVIVFSKNYTESKWCLDELAEIVECKEKNQEVQIRPIFYNVDPSEIRNEKGNFGIALANHEKKFKNNKDKVQRWRDALRKAANASGWHYKKGCTTYKSESDFIENIVEEISNVELNWTPLYVPEYLVGINYRAMAIESLLDIGSDEICMIGVHGLPGVGKTTIAKAVYNRIAKKFDGSSFLENVRENLGTYAGIITLQEQLLNDILGNGNWKVGKLTGISLIEKRLCCKKVFLILDDVDDSTKIENLLGKCNWFAPGSRAIITLRDRHLLTSLKEKFCTTYKVKEFEVEQLNKHEALELFIEHAFPGNKPDEDYSKLATKFIHFANGLPLALEIIARDLCGRAKGEWESALDMYNKIPNKGIQNILQVSYDELQDIEKDSFLDIACFFKGWGKDYVVKILNACELHPVFVIPRLISKCLITIDQYGRLSMHDLIQQMGREVVRQQEPNILEKRSRLHCYEDSLKVLTGNKGSKKIRGIMLHSPQLVEVQLHIEAFRRMKNLKFLIVENVKICEPLELLPNNLILLKWPGYPFHWPSKYFPKQLVAIGMPWSHIRLPKLFKQECRLKNLKDVNLRGCELITELPKLWAPNLEYLNLRYCKNLVKIDECFGSLEKLISWNLGHCEKLQFLPSQLRLKSLDYFDLSGCSRLEKFPNFHQEMKCLKWLLLDGSGIRELPSSIEPLTKLEELRLDGCKNIIELDLLMKPNYFPVLERIYLCKTNIVTIPESISRFPRLKSLSIRDCKLLHEIQGLPQSIIDISAENCMLLDTQSASGLLNQVVEIIGISPNRVCGSAKLMDPRFTNCFPSETEDVESEDGNISIDPQFSKHLPYETKGVEYEDQDVRRRIYVSGTEMPKWFNHQSVENSIFFWVGRKFPKLAVCIALVQEAEVEAEAHNWFFVFFCISINGCEEREYMNRDSYSMMLNPNIMVLLSLHQRSLQQHLDESNPTDKNRIEVKYRIKAKYYPLLIKRWGVHVECICPPQESAIPNLSLLTAGHDDNDDDDDYMRELPFYGFNVKEEFQSPLVLDDDDVDYRSEFTFYGSDDKEEYQSPLVHDDSSMSCMSWLVGPTTKLFKLFCFCCP